MIVIVPYTLRWPEEFAAIGATLRQHLGELALRIDHIGSTSVPGLEAKDIIDVQITVQALTAEVETQLAELGYQRAMHIHRDHEPPTGPADPQEWEKWIFKPVAGRPINIHVRIAGRANQRYALLFRDYLRATPLAAQAYGQTKQALARYHSDDVEAYYDVKDPVCDIIMAGAETWARLVVWQPQPSDQ